MKFPNYLFVMIVYYFKGIFRAGVSNFNVFLLDILCSILLWLKCLSINFRKCVPTFILTSLQKGGG